VGVTEKGFFGSQLISPFDMQIPVSRASDFMQGPFVAMWNSPGFSWLQSLARLKPAITMVQA
jgi:hypothetical protein